MRYAARVDVNQAQIVAALRKAGCFVQPLHMVGQGVPDLLVGRAGNTYLLELKSHHKATLTDEQRRWHDVCQMHVHIVYSAEEALKAVGL